MAGIYLHIPFCKQACSYCDFHFSTSLKHKASFVNALVKEIIQKKDFLKTEINTIYFGGGTPSLLDLEDLNLIIDAIYSNYNIAQNIELTFECNPDDLTSKKLKELKQIRVNRLSIGTQSFFYEDLQFFNRAHNSNQAEQSILLSQDLGFENITIDLIYNTPTLTMQKWEQNLDKVNELKVPHLSAYTLTVEPNTALHHQVKTNQTSLPTDEEAIKQFKLLMAKTKSFGLTQYEVSNFGAAGFYSQHNSNYWKGQEYLGFGPSAHSYYKNKRSWNVSNNIKYIKAINNEEKYNEEELIDKKTAYNEYVLTRLRTIWGIEKDYIETNFSVAINQHFNKELEQYLKTSYLQTKKGKITLTQEGIFIADKISSDLFYIE
ncbi:MAG: radical SAM family heme chaperone HemW [Vicingaceae bacterium]|nr:radical SAM family heme chaperone HemW [Vicingaceae bacterium]